jgi:sterol desaturase/sphingolipid hydroxylase (fatty acid hydroxylase superfamily)
LFEQLIEHYASHVYPAVYFGSLAVTGFWEILFPRRILTASIVTRWFAAAVLMGLNTVLFRFVVPLLSIPFAIWVANSDIGLFNMIEAPAWVAFLVSFWVLDFGRWLQHWMLHRIPILWLVHRAHHTDQDYDFTTGVRFHPADGLFTGAFHLALIAALGAPLEAVVLSEVIQIGFAFFVHGNLKIPTKIDRYLRLVFVTPDVHRLHHSTISAETNANFSGMVTWWDRLFGTYMDQPRGGHEGMTIGLEEFRDPKHLQLQWILANPFLPAEGRNDGEAGALETPGRTR